MFNLFPQKKSVDEILEDSKPKINITAEWNELLKEVLQLRPLKEENEKLKKDIVDYVLEKDDEINNLQKELNHMKAVAEGAISLCDLSDKTDWDLYKAQKHPMYPLHWSGLEPLDHTKTKDLVFEYKKKTPWVEEPIDWVGNKAERKCPCNICQKQP
jgi:hypothetical protein